MKIKGIVTEYNKISGVIEDGKTKYIFTNKNIKKNNKVKKGDIVKFLPETFKTVEVKENIATFIEKIDPNTN